MSFGIIRVQHSGIVSRVSCIAITRCPLIVQNFVCYSLIGALVVVSIRETLCDINMIKHAYHHVGVLDKPVSLTN